MHQGRRRNRRPAQHTEAAQHQPPAFVVAGADVVIVGFFSGRQKDCAALMDSAAREMELRGARVVGRIVQRRGVSDGGARKMALPYSGRTLLTYGKVREAALLCERTAAEAAVFVTPLTPRQRRVLTGMLGCPAVSLADTPAVD
ncbi:hypothetical protein R6V09_05515 [Streptomyces sp. W16]|uniref:hypothetical protein n=1 Tax=Streptomyces sp. W16 TaxID=3076631 RepID=UPI00295A5C53|nr:hypothetical protein [Streptomyces sp. W16]MDV9169594.1 hypothetical protein [Streptomyces sp. W16]